MTKRIFLIAGEPSGDALGAKLMQALKAQSKEPIEFRGVGGEKMEAQGLNSLIPMEDLCVIGIWEVMWQISRLMKIMRGMVEEIEEFDPHALVTIDLPDFNFQVASKIRKRGKTNAKLIHYVAPSVWAWRKGRADKVSKFLDGVMCLLPFEPKYFPKIKAEFVGHSLVEVQRSGNRDEFRSERRPRDKTPQPRSKWFLQGFLFKLFLRLALAVGMIHIKAVFWWYLRLPVANEQRQGAQCYACCREHGQVGQG